MSRQNFGTLMRDLRELRELCGRLRRQLVGAQRVKHERMVWFYTEGASKESLRLAAIGMRGGGSRCELRWNDKENRAEIWQVITEPA